MVSFGKGEFVHYGQYKAPLIYLWLCMKWVDQRLNKEKGFPKLNGRLVILDGHWCFNKEDYEAVKKATRQAVEERKEEFFDGLFGISEEVIERLLAVAKKLEKEPVSEEGLRRLFDVLHEMEYPWSFSLPLSDALEEVIREKIGESKLPEKALESFFQVEKPSPLMQQKREALEIKKGLVAANLWDLLKEVSPSEAVLAVREKNPKIFEEIEAHVEKFKWFGMMHFWGKPFSKEKLFEQMKGLKEKKALEENIELGEELSWIRDKTVRMSYFRQMYADTCGFVSYVAVKKIGEAAKKFGSCYEDARWFSVPEFFDAMQGGKIPGKEEVGEREKAFGLVQEGKEIRIITGGELQKAVDLVVGKASENDEVRGMAASPGIVKGIASIVFKPDEIGKVKQGNVIVAAETTPDFVPAMHKAAAIVTDIGGITSHAAILSREMGIPCIVGTGNATRIIKDGDLLEVNAKEGIVRIIK